ncbi:hypothetical protein OCB02_06795 [Bacillus cereus]|uniref:hypothetical protein n=1 Tax=Bacillus cereus TaxID=1396 RepID=UPI00124512EA|nr:hypothetical protein [Bacillus cereus]MCU5475450.1 hypothetical protein [Bacillus cereus]MCU5614885.1 hypothetical protein [Bacillus cereus]
MSLVYSTGPLENASRSGVPGQSTSVTTKVLNNHVYTTITATIKLFQLDGTKTLKNTVVLTIPPNSSGHQIFDVSTLLEFEIQIKISPSKDKDDVLIGVFGKDASGNLNPSHRLVHKELTQIYNKCIQPCINKKFRTC